MLHFSFIMSSPRRSPARKKIESSIVFSVEVLLLASPTYFLFDSLLVYKLSSLALCFIYVFVGMMREGTFFSMLLVGEKWERKHYTLPSYIVYSTLYTASFSTLLFFIWFPFDLLCINLLCVQLPFVLLTGTTLHGYLSGNIASTNSPGIHSLATRPLTKLFHRKNIY